MKIPSYMRLQISAAFLKIYHMEFKDLIVYKKSLEVVSELESKVFVLTNLDKSIKDQLKRASSSITLNISEGSSRFSPADRKNYFVIARGLLLNVRPHWTQLKFL